MDSDADLNMAEEIIVNAKTQRPGVCNAVETVLVHKDIASEFLPRLAQRLYGLGVEIRICEKGIEIINGAKAAVEEDWATEYLDLILSIKVVESMEEAIDHIFKYGTKHSEAIITNSYKNSQRFLMEVDASCVYVNASTRFTDGCRIWIWCRDRYKYIKNFMLGDRWDLNNLQLQNILYMEMGKLENNKFKIKNKH